MDELKKNQIHTAEITGYSSTGAGVCRILGRAVFVDFTILGEVWEVLILKVTSSAVYGKGLNLIKSSPERVSPICPIFGKCGGCDL
ncbi:MAG: 23S rRNA (uracil(1939)-C(5))-methyltransferase RlmD, partial [Clostridia bacterium]|nr:23S rRNA (uracil(1939)-C(5))-methyltransferase RlmD [Clostridia bacterium]